MIQESFNKDTRALKTEKIKCDFAVVGGGLAGVCAAISAARADIKVVLVQDRPVLGGNASSEVRLWALGATSHMGNNNRWAREGGIIDEILIENVYRNKEGNPLIFDTIVLDKVKSEKNIQLLLNTAVYRIKKSSNDTIETIYGFCSQNYTFYDISSPLFCDASGDGIIAYQAGCSYKMGAESKEEHEELFAPDHGEYGELLGHSIYFYSKDAGKPVKYVAPSYALKDITKIPRYRNIQTQESGCKFWWLEYGGRLDTIHDTEEIKWELWSVVYGVWDYIKNSGKFPDAQNLTLEWVGTIPGKRESRRFLGYYTLVQKDIIEQRHHDDSISFGGWAIDLHPADGVYSDTSGCIQYHSKGVYEIPYSSHVSAEIKNLFYAGRCISATHVAHGSARVMMTVAAGGMAVGAAAAQCIANKILPADILKDKNEIKKLQQSISLAGQSIPKVAINQSENFVSKGTVSTSSNLKLNKIPFDGEWHTLNFSAAQMLPLAANKQYTIDVEVNAEESTSLEVQLRYASKAKNYTPDCIADTQKIALNKGKQIISVHFGKGVPENQYGFVTFIKNEKVQIRQSLSRVTGVLSVFNKFNHDVNNYGKQEAPENSGIESFEFWCPERRPKGYNFAMKISPAIESFDNSNLLNGFVRPSTQANAWIASSEDKSPQVKIEWKESQSINEIILYFDNDFDHALESVQMGHPENIMPFCVQTYKILDDKNNIIYATDNNYQTINRIKLDKKIESKYIVIELLAPSLHTPASLFGIYIK